MRSSRIYITSLDNYNISISKIIKKRKNEFLLFIFYHLIIYLCIQVYSFAEIHKFPNDTYLF